MISAPRGTVPSRRSLRGRGFAAALLAALAVLGLSPATASAATGTGATPLTTARVSPHQVKVAGLPAAKAGGSTAPARVRDQAALDAAKRSPSGPPGQNLSAPGARRTGAPATVTQASSYALMDQLTESPIISMRVEPPDTQIAVGPSSILEMVNSVGAIYSKSTGSAIGSPFSLATFFPLPAGYSFSDPQVLYDPSNQRWYTAALSYNASHSGQVYLGASTTSDPGGTWNIYTVYNNTAGLLCDQPKVGFGGDKLLLGCSQFSSTAFAGAVLIIANKSEIVAGATASVSTTAPDMNKFGITGVTEQTQGTTAYAVYNATQGAPTGSLGLMTVTGTVGTTLSVQSTTLAMTATTFPPNAAQRGSTTQLDTGDDRVVTAVLRGSQVWITAGTGCTPSGDTAVRACAALIDLDVSASRVAFQTAIGMSGSNVMYASAALDGSGNLLLAMSQSDTSLFPSLIATALPAAGGAFDAPVMVRAGTGPYNSIGGGSVARWGDYASAAQDPSDPTKVWIAGEYAATTGTSNDWGTAAAALMRASVTAPGAPTGVTATAGPQSASVSWTAPSSNGGSAITGYVVTPYQGSTALAPKTVGNVLTTTVTALTAGVAYTFTVAAVNSAGTGPQSAASAPVTPTAGTPPPPSAGPPPSPGTFGPPATYPTGFNSMPNGLALADFRGVGIRDVAVLESGYGKVGIFRGNGDGTFQTSTATSYKVGSAPKAVVAVDLRGTGKPDIAIADGNDKLWILLNDGSGNFQPPVTYTLGSLVAPASLIAADFNGDGKQDLAVALLFGNSVAVLFGNGDGTLQAPALYPSGGSPVDVAAGDFRGVGMPDLVVANDTGAGGVTYLRNNGNGTFAAPVTMAAGGSTVAVTVGDFNGDGKLDVAAANHGTSAPGSVSVFLGNGDGTFAAARNIAAFTSPNSIAAGDFNGDGKADLAVTNFNGDKLTTFLSNGDGTFQPGVDHVATSGIPGTNFVRAADLNGDRVLDLAVANTNDGSFSIFLGAPPYPPPSSILDAVSNRQYQLANSDGATWQPIDVANLNATAMLTAGQQVLLSGNADLFTASAGYNQDVGIFVSINGGADQLLAWKESGGFAGTFSPNAAYVQTVYTAPSAATYSFTLKWKTNRPASGATIYAGAGPLPSGGFSPSRITAQILGPGSTTSASTSQYQLSNSDGATWQPIDSALDVTTTPSTGGRLLLGGNVDLFTANAGYNQDVAIFVSVGGGPDTLVAWKESGGFAGTFSPNAAYVQGTYPVTAGTSYTFRLKWKTNRSAPGTTIYAAAGPLPAGGFSNTRLSAIMEPSGVNDSTVTGQYTLTSSDGATWQELTSAARVTITPTSDAVAQAGGNVDLFTGSAGYNQDIAIFVSVNGGADQLVAWKESGGFAGTFSPNAAMVQGTYTLRTGSTYVFKLMWKANRPAPGATIWAGAGPLGGGYSPTRLTVFTA